MAESCHSNATPTDKHKSLNLDASTLDNAEATGDDEMGDSAHDEESSSDRAMTNAELFRQRHLGLPAPSFPAADGKSLGGDEGSRAREALGFGSIGGGLAGVDMGYREGAPLGQLVGSRSVGENAG